MVVWKMRGSNGRCAKTSGDFGWTLPPFSGKSENDRGSFFWAGGVVGAKDKREYGLGFYVARPFVGQVHSVTTVSNRIAFLEVLLKSNSKARTGKSNMEAVKSYETNKRAFEEEAIEGELDGAMDIARAEEEWDTTDRKSTGLQDPWGGKAAAMHQASVDANELFEDLFTAGKDAFEDGKVAKKARF